MKNQTPCGCKTKRYLVPFWLDLLPARRDAAGQPGNALRSAAPLRLGRVKFEPAVLCQADNRASRDNPARIFEDDLVF